MKTKLIVTGYARHGKDSVCNILKDKYNLPFKSSSDIANTLAVYPVLKDIYNYKSPEECFNDRYNHRKEWYDLIVKYNDPLYRLGSRILYNHSIYCGLRNINELKSIKDNLSYNIITVWVDASKRLPPEDSSSITITPKDCDYILDNNGEESLLESKVDEFMQHMEQKYLESFNAY